MAMILNEEQTMLKDSAKDFCTTNAPIGQLRKLRDDANPDGFERGTWASMVELGWAAITSDCIFIKRCITAERVIWPQHPNK